MSTPACATCGAAHAPGDRYCPTCGEQVGPTAESSGSSRPRRWRDLATIVGLVAVLGVGSLVLVSLGDDPVETGELPAVEPADDAPPQPSAAVIGTPRAVSFAYRDRAGVHLVEQADAANSLIEASSVPPEVFPHATLAAVGEWLVFVDDGRARLLDRRGTGPAVDLGPADAVAPWPSAEGDPAVWLIDLDLRSPDVAPTVSAVDLAGRVVVGATSLGPGSRVAGGTIDGLVVANVFADGTFVLDGDGLRSIDDGRVLGVGADWVGVWDCDADLQCGGRLVDLVAGESEPIIGQAPAALRVSVSPDRRWLAQLVAPATAFRGARAGLELVDQTTGGLRRVDVDLFGGERLAWSADGVFLAWTGSNRLWFHDVRDGSLIEFDEPLRASSASPGEVVFLDPLD